MWGQINKLVFNKQNSITEKTYQIEIDGALVTNEAVLSDSFNTYYVNVCDTVITNWNENVLNIRGPIANNVSPFKFTPISESKISKLIDDLNSCSATGIDGISAKFSKKYKENYLSKYTELVNHCIEDCTFPDVLKQAKVIPIYKSGKKTLLKNYRPVSVLNVLSKPFEKILCEQIQVYCTTNNITHQNQFGFVPKSNTMTAAASLTNDIATGLDAGNAVSCMFIDIRKAFDCVHHKLLLNKIKEIGFSEQATRLIESYFKNRTQIVKINSAFSSPKQIKHGVPQGSILGPLLFTLYINDVFKLPLKGKLQLYADDATILYVVTDLITLKSYIEHDLEMLMDYFTRNHMAINLEKTNFIIFKVRGYSPRLNITVNQFTVEQVSYARYLGLIIDENLKWNQHTRSIISKITPYMFALKKIRYLISERTAWNIYFAYIHPHLAYMNSIWGSTTINHLHNLKVIQNKSIKIIKLLPSVHPTSDLYNTKVLPISLLNKFEICCYIFKITKNLIKTNIQLVYISDIHSRNTRNNRNMNLYALKSRTQLAQNSILQRGIRLYNSLPYEIRQSRSISSFKYRVKQNLVEHFLHNTNTQI